MSLLLVPASKENLEVSIEKPIDIDYASHYLNSDTIQEIILRSGNEGIRCWAATENKKKFFSEITEGDEVLFSEKNTGQFTHYGIVTYKIINENFGKNLWPLSGNSSWKNIYFLANIQRIKIDKAKLVADLGYSSSFTVPGAIRINEERYKSIGAISERFDIQVHQHLADEIPINDYSSANIETIATRRINHAKFARIVKRNYNYKCAICGIAEIEFLVAGHISTWAEDDQNRLNPSNGICLCSLHDKAFECGYIGLDNNYRVIINKNLAKESILRVELQKFSNKKIASPLQNPPDSQLLAIHRKKHGL